MVQIQMQSMDETKRQKKKKIMNGPFHINDLNENANNYFCSLNI